MKRKKKRRSTTHLSQIPNQTPYGAMADGHYGDENGGQVSSEEFGWLILLFDCGDENDEVGRKKMIVRLRNLGEPLGELDMSNLFVHYLHQLSTDFLLVGFAEMARVLKNQIQNRHSTW